MYGHFISLLLLEYGDSAKAKEPSAKNQVHLEWIPVENPICGLIDYSDA